MKSKKNKYISDDLLAKHLTWIGVDWDDTIAYKTWPEKGIGEPVAGSIESLKSLQADGWKICIYTARPWADYIAIKEWCKDHDFIPDHLWLGKPLVKMMIDDNAYRLTDWKTDLPKIKQILEK